MSESSYPEHSAGWKGLSETGRNAAKNITQKRPKLWEQVLVVLAEGPATPEMIADRIGRHFTTVRPRCSELRRLGRVVDTGHRGNGALGGRAIIFRIATPEEAAQAAALRAAKLEKGADQ